MNQAFVSVCLLLLERMSSVNLKSQLLTCINQSIQQGPGKHFRGFADSLTQSQGLDLLLTNLQVQKLRPKVL
jgi:hypothetical protein